MPLLVIDLFAAVFVIAGFHLAFRQALVRAWWARLRRRDPAQRLALARGGEDPLTPVLRMAGVMLMAFSFSVGAFANLIAHFAAAGPITD